MFLLPAFILALGIASSAGQRITTIQLDGVQYFISRMNPYSPELNYFLAYQYCRSIGLQLASFETKEKSDSIMEYLKNAGYDKYEFWTSGNRLGTDMMIWMSTGLPFNATFDYMRKAPGEESLPVARQLGAVEQRKDSGAANGCVALRAPDLIWDTDDCTNIKDFICEQTRCYYYNYGSIPVSSAQGHKRVKLTSTTTTSPTSSSTTSSIASTTTTIPPSNDETTSNSPTTESPLISTSDSVNNSSTETYSNNVTEPITGTSIETTTLDYTTETENEETPELEPLIKVRSTLSRSNPAEQNNSEEAIPWSWARNIMLEKPVLKKSASL